MRTVLLSYRLTILPFYRLAVNEPSAQCRGVVIATLVDAVSRVHVFEMVVSV